MVFWVRKSEKIRVLPSWAATSVVFLFMALLLSCPSAYGYFPNPDDRIPASEIGSNAATVSEPFWRVRILDANGVWSEWGTINGPVATFENTVQLFARSATSGARVLYTGNAALPGIKSDVLTEKAPIEIRGSSTGEHLTAIALASQQYPSIFKSVVVTIDASKVGTPTFNKAAVITYTEPQSLEIRAGASIPGRGPIRLQYTSTTDGSEPSDPTAPINPDDPSAPQLYEGAIEILPEAGDIFKIRIVGIHPDLKNSTIVDATFARVPELIISLTGEGDPPNNDDSPNKNDFTKPQILRISSIPDTASIYYDSTTMAGASLPDPTNTSLQYTGAVPIEILKNYRNIYRIKAIAIIDDGRESSIVSRSYGRAASPVIAANAGGDQSVGAGVEVTLNGSRSSPNMGDSIADFQWVLTESSPSGTAIIPDVNDDMPGIVTFTAPDLAFGDRLTLTFELTIMGSSEGSATASTTVSVFPIADADGNGLIEISTLEELHNMRYDLSGTSYKTSTTAIADSFGCPTTGCFGYELTQDLDFDADSDGSTWSRTGAGFTLDVSDDDNTYFDVDAGGWLPIGDLSTPFTATFDGKGHRISNLAIQRNTVPIGFFGNIARSAVIRNIGLIDNLADFTGIIGVNSPIGGLVGQQTRGSIIASYTTGPAEGGVTSFDRVGSLVGYQGGGIIIASYATGPANGHGGSTNYVGGLVGQQQGSGVIIASYATGDSIGSSGSDDRSGALVGSCDRGSIIASYATGDVTSGDGIRDAMGVYNPGGTMESVGRLAGRQDTNCSITASYGFGVLSVNSMGTPTTAGDPPAGLTPANLKAEGERTLWNNAVSSTRGAWDFGGNAADNPVLRYADYDDGGVVYSCDMFPTGLCGTIIPGQER